ncbi:glycosyltransferase family 2 protein [Fundidesulfovibrio agrisoli]|uniref:glycosyltransferase family 2 protein n=1 Tax=Fundidesulfovibrio agrisoli TaxID=2922717 RepID=UPI001FADFB47|nr:glycosyltransferase family 2 protein [Fundidesulfovibrio agrisoli]
MDVSFIYVNWNSQGEIMQSVRTVREQTRGLSYEIVVVDNDSAQGVDELAADPGIVLVRNTANAGFGAGCNLGVRHSTGRYLFFFNPDTRMVCNAAAILCAYLDAHPRAGAAGPKILESDGSIHYGGARSFHSLFNEFLEHSALAFRFPRNPIAGRPYYSTWDHDSTREVDAIHGAAMVFRRDVFERLGGFDERYFLYCEEVDLCKRTWNAGYSVHYVHTASIIHSGKHSSNQYFDGFHPLILQHVKSLAIFMRTHYGPVRAAIWRAMIVILYGLKALRNRDPRYLDYCRWGLRGV